MSATVVTVEVDVARGLPSVGIVGLPQASVAEAKWRVRSAVENAGLQWPASRITIGLSPADVPKSGTSLDLPIAVGILRATEQVPEASLHVDGLALFLGELGLDGSVRPVRGALAAVIAARRAGVRTVVAPVGNAADIDCVPGMSAVCITDLPQLARVLSGQDSGCRVAPVVTGTTRGSVPDFAEVRGQAHARYALEVAAAGSHHCSLVGPPGAGKTMLASRLAGILPDLDDDLALEVTSIHALAGQRPIGQGVERRPPCIAPHHSSSAVSILGTIRGSHPVPGALTLAHGGVLFLDEAPEFSRPALEGLRQPLESGTVSIMRAGQSAHLPARFQLVLAANPCPCGMAVGRGDGCRCTSVARRRYAERLSGPLLDRIDIRLAIAPPAPAEAAADPGESTSSIAARVRQARERAAHRFSGLPWSVNAQIPPALLRRQWAPDASGQSLLEQVSASMTSLRGLDRVVRLAWSVADLRGAARPGADHVAIALGLRAESP
ncbi:MAG: YifB family Mg chelatase-like AAA ATPase [Actinomycetales bacterium]|nr:YifB family Mg chelatase-like AAA ATPase [Actinomycetales bacterium]